MQVLFRVDLPKRTFALTEVGARPRVELWLRTSVRCGFDHFPVGPETLDVSQGKPSRDHVPVQALQCHRRCGFTQLLPSQSL